MKQLIIGIVLGSMGGIIYSAWANSEMFINAEPFKVVMAERNFVNTTKVKTEDGTYRIFTIESTQGDGGSVGITAVKID